MWPTFPLLLWLFIKFTQNLVRHFYTLELFWIVYFLFWEILNLILTIAVLGVTQNLSII